MAKKPKKQADVRRSKNEQEQYKQEVWMMRVKVGAIYLVIWFVTMAWVMNNLPLPNQQATTEFYNASKAHWFMNAGFLIMFIMIMTMIGKREEEEEQSSEDQGTVERS